jgi:hypothetical protein
MISDQEIVGLLMLMLGLAYVGYRIDMERISVTNRSVLPKTERGEAPSTDLRLVGWIEDPIETRVVGNPPYAGTTGDIEPDIMESKEAIYAVITGDTRPLLAPTGACAICTDSLHGPERVCARCFHERAGT